VKYDEGRIEIDGIQLLQDSDNALAYYYIPPYPRVSVQPDGEFEFLCLKYVGGEKKSDNGGLFHALIEFSLTPAEGEELAKQLRDRIPGAVLMGPVPMAEGDVASGTGFRIISSILHDSSASKFTLNLVSSGRAPLLPGSRAAIAAHLTQDGATLLWNAFQGTTSDVSVVVSGYFRARLRAYKATVAADLSLVYNHFSSFNNAQSGFSREQATNILDSLCQSGTIKIDVADLSAGLDINSQMYQTILQMITDKVVDAMFNVTSGWAKLPATEAAIEPHDLKGRYEHGALVSFFVGDGSQPYVPDQQLLLKTKTEIRNFNFFLDLNQSVVINVPVHSAGNIRGFYNSFKDDARYFRIVDMDDPDFQNREVHFQINGNFLSSFGEIIDQVSVLIEKDYPEDIASPYSGSLIFNKASIDSGDFIQKITYRRLGDRSDEWSKYKYKVGWKFIGIDSLITTPGQSWFFSSQPAVTLEPPLEKKDIEIGFDRRLLIENGIQSVRIRFASVLFGKPFKGKMVVVRLNDASDPEIASVYHDAEAPVVYQVSWFSGTREVQDDLMVLRDDFLFLIPPDVK
jgi:hypothetical protein